MCRRTAATYKCGCKDKVRRSWWKRCSDNSLCRDPHDYVQGRINIDACCKQCCSIEIQALRIKLHQQGTARNEAIAREDQEAAAEAQRLYDEHEKKLNEHNEHDTIRRNQVDVHVSAGYE